MGSGRSRTAVSAGLGDMVEVAAPCLPWDVVELVKEYCGVQSFFLVGGTHEGPAQIVVYQSDADRFDLCDMVAPDHTFGHSLAVNSGVTSTTLGKQSERMT